jgi:hypothetical protein
MEIRCFMLEMIRLLWVDIDILLAGLKELTNSCTSDLAGNKMRDTMGGTLVDFFRVLRFVLFSPPAFEPEIDQTKPGEESSEILSFNGLLQANFVHLTLDVVSSCWGGGKGIEVWGVNDRNVGGMEGC